MKEIGLETCQIHFQNEKDGQNIVKQKMDLKLTMEELCSWEKYQKMSILFFDGSSKLNPWMTGSRGIIYDSEGHK